MRPVVRKDPPMAHRRISSVLWRYAAGKVVQQVLAASGALNAHRPRPHAGRFDTLDAVAQKREFPGQDGADGKNGKDGQDGSSCTVTDNGDGSKTISCDDGTSATVTDGENGEDGGAAASRAMEMVARP
jgi:hypothetical protein